ncbi:MAG: hypothetical protein Q7R22_015110 [Verrucomicrobiota bacterium JB025]|nr:hypothetical protein [Verrucomicrobiota bacterium JB025]
MDESELHELIELYSEEQRISPFEGLNEPHSSESPQMMQARLERAALNQICGGEATLSRYRIWMETVRGVLVRTIAEREGTSEGPSTEELVMTANSLACFCEIQNRLDP